MRRTALAPATIVITIALAAMLAGCAPTPSSSNNDRDRDSSKSEEVEEVAEQSTTAACRELADASTVVAGAITDSTTLLATDPAAAADDISEATIVFEDAVNDIENDDVREAAAPITEGLNHFAEAITIFAGDPVAENLDALTASSEEVNGAFTDISAVCD